MAPELAQHPLDRADGSAIFSDGVYAVLAAVNGPVEVQRRDELPEEAAIEVNVRPPTGSGGPRERWLETVLQSTIRTILLVNMHPRTLIQITLQINKTPALKLPKPVAAVAVIPALINAAILALVDGGLPLASTATAVLVAVSSNGKIDESPTDRDLASCGSVHAMAFTQHGDQLLDESSGRFDMSTWNAVVDLAQSACFKAVAPNGDDAAMANDNDESSPWLRNALQQQTSAANAWRQTV